MTERSAAHATFTVERDLAFAPATVFRAFSDAEAKLRWFGPPDGAPMDYALDFRVGGREHAGAGEPTSEGSFTFDAVYHDIVPGERIVYTYGMTMNGRPISASVATIVLVPTATGTHVRLTEQGVFLDGLDQNAARERGTNELLDALAASLAAQPAGVAG
ncbi:MAG TPA: SRPBCC family protein [Candidatus Limnocylindrales bacterium]|nr:SRPBCC family protein [Candidatus Limnocylindrales bacterium]